MNIMDMKISSLDSPKTLAMSMIFLFQEIAFKQANKL